MSHRLLVEKFLNNKSKISTDKWESCMVEWFVVNDKLKYAVTEYGEFIRNGVIFARLSLNDDNVHTLTLTRSFDGSTAQSKCLSHWFDIYTNNLEKYKSG